MSVAGGDGGGFEGAAGAKKVFRGTDAGRGGASRLGEGVWAEMGVLDKRRKPTKSDRNRHETDRKPTWNRPRDDRADGGGGRWLVRAHDASVLTGGGARL